MTVELVARPLADLAAVTPDDALHEALERFRLGGMLIVTDDDGRENEGDLIMAAVHCRPEDMAFIVRHTSGIVCAPVTADIATRLHLPLMVQNNDAPFATAFTVSIDLRNGTTTGISAADRSATVRALASETTEAVDFVRPGHIFPLIAHEGGVLARAGHTEAAVDLCRLTGLPPVGVICELVCDDGTVMRGESLHRFRRQTGLPQISVADLIRLRRHSQL